MIKRIFLVIFLIFGLTFVPKAIAEESVAGSEFTTSYDVVYEVGLDGVTTVTEKIVLRNLTSEYFANQFKFR